MKTLEFPATIRRANKYDLFVGDLDNLHGQQDLKINATVFYRNLNTNQIEGPVLINEFDDFTALYSKMLYGKVGVIAPMPDVIKSEIVFHFILREASMEDIWLLNHTPVINKMYYTYGKDKKLMGPFFITGQTNMIILQRMLEFKEVFVANEKQHFEFREYQKIA